MASLPSTTTGAANEAAKGSPTALFLVLTVWSRVTAITASLGTTMGGPTGTWDCAPVVPDVPDGEELLELPQPASARNTARARIRFMITCRISASLCVRWMGVPLVYGRADSRRDGDPRMVSHRIYEAPGTRQLRSLT